MAMTQYSAHTTKERYRRNVPCQAVQQAERPSAGGGKHQCAPEKCRSVQDSGRKLYAGHLFTYSRFSLQGAGVKRHRTTSGGDGPIELYSAAWKITAPFEQFGPAGLQRLRRLCRRMYQSASRPNRRQSYCRLFWRRGTRLDGRIRTCPHRPGR